MARELGWGGHDRSGLIKTVAPGCGLYADTTASRYQCNHLGLYVDRPTILAGMLEPSRLLLTRRTWICIFIAWAAGFTSLNVASVIAALTGLTSTATRAAAGTSSRRSSSRLATNSTVKIIDTCQVAARPGKAGDKTKPNRVFGDDEDDGDGCGCRLGRESRRRTSGRGNHGDLSTN